MILGKVNSYKIVRYNSEGLPASSTGSVCISLLMILIFVSGIARPGPTRACALPSTFQALPSLAKQESGDSIMNQIRKQMHYSSYNASISVCMQHIVNLLINTLQLTKYFRPLSVYKIC